jgi:hypothetical protein
MEGCTASIFRVMFPCFNLLPSVSQFTFVNVTNVHVHKLNFLFLVTHSYTRDFLIMKMLNFPPCHAFSRLKRACKMRCVKKSACVQETPTMGRTSINVVYLTYSFHFFALWSTVIFVSSSVSLQSLST